MGSKSEPGNLHNLSQTTEVLTTSNQTMQFKIENLQTTNLSLQQENGDLSTGSIKKEQPVINDEDSSQPCEGFNKLVLKANTWRKKTYVCPVWVCGYTTGRKLAFTSHLRTHSGKSYFECVQCGSKIKNQIHMNVHAAVTYKCPTCESNKSEINSNKPKSKEKFYNCGSCGFKAAGKHHFEKQHKLVCDRVEKPFTCALCDYRCVTQSALTDHLITHIGENPFPCGTCNYRTNSHENLEIHIRETHKPFLCTMCDYRCASQPTLTMHVKTVHGKREETIKCEVESGSVVQENLKTHIKKTHKPFVCTMCNYRCASKPTLTMHVKTFHGKMEDTIKCEVESESEGQKTCNDLLQDSIQSKWKNVILIKFENP